jgi:hypothetical protein
MTPYEELAAVFNKSTNSHSESAAPQPKQDSQQLPVGHSECGMGSWHSDNGSEQQMHGAT